MSYKSPLDDTCGIQVAPPKKKCQSMCLHFFLQQGHVTTKLPISYYSSGDCWSRGNLLLVPMGTQALGFEVFESCFLNRWM